VSEEAGGRAGEAADTELKTKTPHVNVGNYPFTAPTLFGVSCRDNFLSNFSMFEIFAIALYDVQFQALYVHDHHNIMSVLRFFPNDL